jgi:hypothetical protein
MLMQKAASEDAKIKLGGTEFDEMEPDKGGLISMREIVRQVQGGAATAV